MDVVAVGAVLVTLWVLCLAVGYALDEGRGLLAAFFFGPLGVVLALVWRVRYGND